LTNAARVTDKVEIKEALAGINAWDHPIITTREDSVIRVRRITSFNESSGEFRVVPKSGSIMSIHLDEISQVERQT
jgi:hypothetical protein